MGSFNITNRSFTLLGHNGSGKSTIIKYLLGFYPNPSSHKFLNTLSKNLPILDISSVGYVPEQVTLAEEMSGEEYVDLVLKLKNISTTSPNFFDKVSLRMDNKIPIKHYSKGMKQKLLLALLLIHNPKNIILDEPTSGLDIFMTKEIEDLLLELNVNHNLIISTHSVSLAHKLGNEILVLKNGEVFFNGFLENEKEIEEKLLESMGICV